MNSEMAYCNALKGPRPPHSYNLQALRAVEQFSKFIKCNRFNMQC